MRLKLDENLPQMAAGAAAELGHDVDTVGDEHLSGAADSEVLDAAAREQRFLLTLDRGFGDIRRYPPGSHAGIAVLRVDSQAASAVSEAVRAFLVNDTIGDVTGCLVIVRNHLIRVRRPQ